MPSHAVEEVELQEAIPDDIENRRTDLWLRIGIVLGIAIKCLLLTIYYIYKIYKMIKNRQNETRDASDIAVSEV